MAKRSVSLFGFKPKYRRITAESIITFLRSTGMTDEQIEAELLKLKNDQDHPRGEEGER